MPYSTRSDIELIFGAVNVSKWADLDNEQVANDITARITSAITNSDSEIDSYLRERAYSLPLSEPYDPVIVELSARLAGLRLYEARGMVDDDGDYMTRHRKRCTQTLTNLLNGRVRINHTRAKRVPGVVNSTEET